MLDLYFRICTNVFLIHPDSTYQFYKFELIWAYIEVILAINGCAVYGPWAEGKYHNVSIYGTLMLDIWSSRFWFWLIWYFPVFGLILTMFDQESKLNSYNFKTPYINFQCEWTFLKGLPSENDIESYFIEKSVLISKIWLKIS